MWWSNRSPSRCRSGLMSAEYGLRPRPSRSPNPTYAARMEQSLLVLVAAALFALVAVGAVAAWTVRVVWYRLRRGVHGEPAARRGPVVRRRLGAIGRDLGPLDLAGLGLRAVALRPRTSVGWWSARVSRRRLRLAVSAAYRTVAVAERSQAALGDLPELCRELRRLHRDLDRRLLLAAAHARRPDPTTAVQVATMRAHADRIRLLAGRCLDEVTEPALHRFTVTIETEAAALDAGLASLRRQTDPRLPARSDQPSPQAAPIATRSPQGSAWADCRGISPASASPLVHARGGGERGLHPRPLRPDRGTSRAR